MEKRIKKLATVASCAVLLFPTTMKAQSGTTITATADLVSNYFWRGENLGGISVQPTLGIGIGGLSVSAWGNVGVNKEDTREFDLTAAYTIKKVNIGITDYSFVPWDKTADQSQDVNYFDYSCKSAKSTHVYEANIGYNFGPVSLQWYTNIGGKDYYKKNSDKRAYSSYVEADAPFKLGGLDMKAELGITPWDGAYTIKTDKFSVVDIGLTAKKTVKITDSFSIPAYVKAAVNPEASKAYLIFGITL